jgi:Putative translation initiation inhibitor, yjgF family
MTSHFRLFALLAVAWASLQPRSAASQATSSLAVPGSSSVEGAGYLYISAQGPHRADGTSANKFTDQARQCLDNIKDLVEAAGLTMNHVVYIQVYLQDVSHYDELNNAFAAYFPKDPPARSVLGVARVPEPPLQMNAVAVRDRNGKQSVAVPGWPASQAYSAGMLTRDRLFVSTMLGRDPVTGTVPQGAAAQVDMALDGLAAVLTAAGLSNFNMVFVNPYLTADIPMRIMNEHYARRFEFGNTPGRATIQVSSLPEGAHIAYTGVAVRDLSQRLAIRPKNMPPSPTASPCVFAGDTLYCSAKSGFIPGPNGGVYFASTADQTRQTMRNLLDNLEEAEMNFDQVVSATTYLDDLAESPQYSAIYAKYFKGALPAQTTVQQIKSGDRKPNAEGQYADLEQMSLIAVRHPKASNSKPAQ